MPETLLPACTPPGIKKWHWYSVLKDLVEQGGLEKDDIQWSFQDPQLFLYKGKQLVITWAQNKFMLISMERDDEDFVRVVEAFSKIVEYKPFCKYVEPDSGLTTYEWDKECPKIRYEELLKEGKKKNLTLLAAI